MARLPLTHPLTTHGVPADRLSLRPRAVIFACIAAIAFVCGAAPAFALPVPAAPRPELHVLAAGGAVPVPPGDGESLLVSRSRMPRVRVAVVLPALPVVSDGSAHHLPPPAVVDHRYDSPVVEVPRSPAVRPIVASRPPPARA